jgi:hypothetical protein
MFSNRKWDKYSSNRAEQYENFLVEYHLLINEQKSDSKIDWVVKKAALSLTIAWTNPSLGTPFSMLPD